MIASTMRALAWIIAVAVVACGSSETEQSRFGDEDDGGVGASGPTTGVGGVPVTTGVGASMGGAPVTSTGPGGSPVTTSSSSGMPCNDPGPEPNNSIGQATYLGSIDDCDSSGLTFSGVLEDSDVDWFTYDALDVAFCSVGAERTISADGQVRLCKYVDCLSGGTTITCPAGSTADNSNGLDGCCSTTGVSFGVDCNGLSDDATIYLRIDKPGGFSCVTYSGTFHY